MPLICLIGSLDNPSAFNREQGKNVDSLKDEILLSIGDRGYFTLYIFEHDVMGAHVWGNRNRHEAAVRAG